MSSETDPFVDWDGPYVLGALSAADRRDYEQHLAVCDRCARSVGELAGLPGVLGLVPAEQALAIDDARPEAETARGGEAGLAPSVSLLARRARAARTRQRRVLAAAAVVLVLAGGSAGALLAQGAGPQGTSAVIARGEALRLEPVGASGVHADLTLLPADWGTRLEWSCSYPSDYPVAGVEYELTLVDHAGERLSVATWTGGSSPTVTGLTATTSLTPEKIARIEMSTTTTTAPLAAITL